ncbi:N-6 DNA methylase [Clostridium sp.]|uniref:N-6 DNA methylase n=1 Tax=Clostridium sp. TaxID=1506 RepID=UPI002624F45F|nr:N-6 DNA methylase [Clostridium sp.]
MGRKEKLVIKELKTEEVFIDKRELGYYSTPDYICDYIKERLLEINNKGESILDPCCGKEEMLNPFKGSKIKSYGMDIFKYKEEYNCIYKKGDFIEFYFSNLDKDKSVKSLEYDYYVLNPPYNCHEVDYIKNNKTLLKGYFGEVGIQNMYLIFISSIIDLAKEGALIGIITNDSFLTAKSYKNFREKILKSCSIHEITMCPNDTFHKEGADVRTSILILQKGVRFQSKVVVNNRSKDAIELKKIFDLKSGSRNKCFLEDIILNNKEDNKEFLIGCPKQVKALFNNERLGNRYKCISGISTGNDKLYLSKEKVYPYTIDFYKNPGKDKFYTNKRLFINEDFLSISKDVTNFIVRNKDLLFKSGIICSSMGVEFSAAKLEENSTFGVNSAVICSDEESYFLLSYLNSTLVTYLVRGVLNRSNMITSGYISRIPIIKFNKDQKERLIALGKLGYKRSKNNEDIKEVLIEIDKIINNFINLKEENIKYINNFRNNLVKLT